jgi:hypothetical protein
MNTNFPIKYWLAALSLSLCAAVPASAQKISVAVATSVTDTAGLLDTKETFAPVAEAIAKSVKATAFSVSPVAPTLLPGTLSAARDDVMVVLASDGWRAQNEFGWKLVALSDDAQGNVVHLIAGKNTAIANPGALKGKKLGASGVFARDVLNALLKQNGVINQVAEIRDARDPQALEYFLTNGFADVVITRDPAQIKRLTDAGHKVLLKTEPIPVYAVIVNTKADLERTEKIRNTVTALKLPPEFSRASGIRAFKPVSADHAVALSLFD